MTKDIKKEIESLSYQERSELYDWLGIRIMDELNNRSDKIWRKIKELQ